ncbi:hypothetical protein HPP92_028352 [Vanilla planifolia]|uniref:Uncharacterized protein n=1 Tax=Vanilla planifolia TaxID=51239 RepID=A0A835U2S9_VANPL|nr:hypothetical protein HPP92_028352 [Vanilla planifolia]
MSTECIHFVRLFTLFDYEDDSIEDLRLLIVRCVISPVYLKTKEGRGFIAFILGLNRQLLKEALVLIRSQIPFGKKSVLEGYAEILFKAWRGSVDFTKEEIENGFLQGLVEGAIFAQNKQLASSIRRVLSGFVCQRATSGVDKLLFHLAEPLLFRSLQVANSNVRHNALFLFLDLFPIEDPDVTKEEKDILLEKQYFLLQKLLMDECPESHEIMKVLLPRIGYLLSDPCLSVRVSAADLLLEVGQTRTFQLNKVVSLDSLFSSLADDHERVARKLTRLLIPSYLPSKVTPKEACNRFFTLMRRAPVAGARFCEFALSEGSSLKTLMELLRFSLGLVLTGSGLSSGQIDGLITASANICSTTSVQARIAVLGIASMVSPDDLGELHDRCIIFVIECTDLSDDQERKGLLSAVHRLMLDCGWFDELVEILTCILKTIAAGILAKFSADVPHQVFQSLKKKHKLPMKISTKIGFLNGKGSKVPDKSKIKKAFNLAAGIAWQLKELIVNVDMRKALLKSPNLEDAFYSLKIISQIFIGQCVNFEFFDTSPIMCLATLSLCLSLENDDSVILNDDVQSGSEA